MRQALPRDCLLGQLLRAELVHEVILSLVAQYLETILEVLFNEFGRDIASLAEIGVALLFGTNAESLEGPKTCVTKERAHVGTHSF